MGQKVHPFGFRLGYNKTWNSRWYAKKDYASLLHEDLRLKKELHQKLITGMDLSAEPPRLQAISRDRPTKTATVSSPLWTVTS